MLLALGFPTMGAPAMKVGRRRVAGTRWIARALDEIYPDNPLFPADPAQRRTVQRAERWGEELQNSVRRIFYCAARRDRQAFISVIGSGRGPVRTRGVRVHGTGHRPARHRRCTARPTRPAARTSSCSPSAWTRSTPGSPRACSAASAQRRRLPDRRQRLGAAAVRRPRSVRRGPPGRALARRVAPDYVGHLGPVVPDEWMDELRAAHARSAAIDRGRAASTRAGGPGAATPRLRVVRASASDADWRQPHA